MQQVYGLADLAAALGRSKTYAWYLVQATLDAQAGGAGVRTYLLPYAYVRKGRRQEVLFTADQLAQARHAMTSAADGLAAPHCFVARVRDLADETVASPDGEAASP